MSEDLRPPPDDWDFGGAWAEIERSRFGYSISAGYGPLGYERMWFRFTHKSARRKAQRLIDRENRQRRRHDERERLT